MIAMRWPAGSKDIPVIAGVFALVCPLDALGALVGRVSRIVGARSGVNVSLDANNSIKR